MSNRFFVSFLFLVFLADITFAQSNISKSNTFSLNTKTVDAHSSRNKQLVYFTLSNLSVNDVSFAEIDFSFDSNLELKGSDIYLSINNLNSNSKIFYRQFDVSKYVVPDMFYGNVEFVSDGKRQSISFDTESIENQSVKLYSFSEQTSDIALYDLHFDRIDYTDGLTEKIEAMIREINDFQSVELLFEFVIEQNRKKTSDDDVLLLFNYWDISRKALLISKKYDERFFQRFDYINFDYSSKKEQVERLNQRFETLLVDAVKNGKKHQFITSQFVESYLNYLQFYKVQANTIELRDSEAFRKMTKVVVDEVFVQMLNLILVNLYMPTLQQDLFDALFLQVEHFIEQSDYAQAIDILENLEGFSFVENFEQQEIRIHQKKETAKTGLLNDYLRIATRAVIVDNQSLSSSYIEKAINYFKNEFSGQLNNELQRASAEFLGAFQQKATKNLNDRNYSKAIDILEEAKSYAVIMRNTYYQVNFNDLLSLAHNDLYWNILAEAQQKFFEKNIDEANFLIEKALKYALTNSAYIADNSSAVELQRQIQAPYYDEILENSLITAKRGDRQKALELLQSANQISEQYSLNANKNIDSITLVVVKPLVINKLRSSYVKIWANDIDAAWKIYEEAKQISDDFYLSDNVDVKKEFEKFDNNVIERICMNRRIEVEDLTQIIEVKANQQKVFEVKEALEKAYSIVDQNCGCMIDTKELEKYRQFYASFFQYEEQYRDVLNVMYSEGFRACIPLYLAFDQQVEKFGLEKYNENVHKNLFSFLESQKNGNLTLMVLDYFLEQNDESELRKYLDLFICQDFFVNDQEKLLYKIGSYLGQSDNISQSEKTKSVIDYMAKNKKYKDFVKGYNRNFN